MLSVVGPPQSQIALMRKDFRRLRRSTEREADDGATALYLNDQCEDALGHCLNVAAKASSTGNCVHVWPTHVVHRCLGFDTEAATVEWIARLVRKQKSVLVGQDGTNRCRAWLLPCFRNEHCTCGLICFRSKQVVFADSLGSLCPDRVTKFCCFLEVAWQALHEKSFDFEGWHCGSLGALGGAQPNYHDCGVFPVTLARCIHHNVKLQHLWSQAEMDSLRDVLTLELLQGRLLSTTTNQPLPAA